MINKLLCKYCDSDKKGYVTLADLIEHAFAGIFLIGISIFAVYCMYQTVATSQMGTVEYLSDWQCITGWLGTVFWLVFAFGLTFGSLYAFAYAISKLHGFLQNIKVAECKYKK